MGTKISWSTARSAVLTFVLALTLTICRASAELTTNSPGPFESERQALMSDINVMEKAGVGVKPYVQVFEEMDGLVRANAQEEKIKEKLDQLKESLQKQKQAIEKIKAEAQLTKSVNASFQSALRKTKPRPLSRTTPLSLYCASIEDAIRRKWTPVTGTDNDVSIDFSVDASGVIKNVVANKQSKGSPSAQSSVVQKIRSVGKVGVLPGQASPLNLRLQVCKKHGIEVFPNIDYSEYMADLQRRIKRAWFPPKQNVSKRVLVSFRVRSDGQISDLFIEESSGQQSTDQAAIKALHNAVPFRPLPPGSIEEVEVNFSFDYNVHSGSGRAGFRSEKRNHSEECRNFSVWRQFQCHAT